MRRVRVRRAVADLLLAPLARRLLLVAHAAAPPVAVHRRTLLAPAPPGLLRPVPVRWPPGGCPRTRPPKPHPADVCSPDLVTVGPDDDIDKAVDLMRSRALRRLPVTEGGSPVGVVSLGDLAIGRDGSSALADISQAPPNT
ncbi:hypothetical protein C0216_19435 [Streptomyces globosus]|uniref:CBS domain-containing protein n=1 Tax=Streptomyces globosus TaxID=68209 RepID=A0A344U359_9ACTN|nr:hypothetical protein C0216_19435 [Streptomyces globosus]